MIEEYEFGKIRIDGKEYSKDIIIIRGRVKSEWWREQGHFLQNKDLKEVYDAEPEILVVGTGHDGMMKISEDVRKKCREKEIELVEMKTGKAVEKFNGLSEKKKNAAGAFHLTC